MPSYSKLDYLTYWGLNKMADSFLNMSNLHDSLDGYSVLSISKYYTKTT